MMEGKRWRKIKREKRIGRGVTGKEMSKEGR